jgi:hypothetical protein
MERRQYRRVPAQVKSLLRANSHEVEGQTVDLSVGGARMESDLVFHPGKPIIVKLILPDVAQPVFIEQAQVQWIHDQTFGIKFLEVRQQELDELEQLIEDCIALDERGEL